MDALLVRYIVGIVVGLLVALFVAPLFPYPVSTIFVVLGYLCAGVCTLLLVLAFMRGTPTRGPRV